MVESKLPACEYKVRLVNQTGKTLGQGSYATVKEAIKISTGELYACKVISKALMRGKEQMIVNEIEVLKKVSLGHPNIVTLYDYFETPNNLYLVMDLCTGGELFDRLCERGFFYELDAIEVIRTVLRAIQYLHGMNIVHRDLKPENLLFKSRDPDSPLLIADFGLAKMMDYDQIDALRTTCGTPGYIAPEVLERLGHGKPCDMWSIGCMTYFLLVGYLPFETPDHQIDYHRLRAGMYSFDDYDWKDISSMAKQFISDLLVVDPRKRMTVADALNHPWLYTSVAPNKVDLFPKVRQGFNARKQFQKAFLTVRAARMLNPKASVANFAAIVK